jgi:hypothetical protein
MLFKTIVLGLLEEAYPGLHRHLCRGRSLARELDRYAAGLREDYQQRIASGLDPGAARELAVQELRERLNQEAVRLGV